MEKFKKSVNLTYSMPKDKLIGAIKDETPFTLCTGGCAFIDEDGTYTILSYGTVILKRKNGKTISFNETKYSSTTSKLQNLIREALAQ